MKPGRDRRMVPASRFLIVNGDDFGLTKGVNKGVLDCYKKGILTSATLLAGLPASEEAVRLARDSSLSVGLHLNLGLTPASLYKDAHVPFIASSVEHNRVYLIWLLSTMKDQFRKHLLDFFRCQVEWALKRKIDITHLDTHKHIHLWPPVARLVCIVAKEYGIRAVRFPCEPFWAKGALNLRTRIPLFVLYVFGILTRRVLKRAKVKSPDHFRGIINTGWWSKKRFLETLKTLPDGVTEVMVHPGYREGLSREFTRLLSSREREVKILTDPEVVNFCAENSIQLVNYNHVLE